MTRWSIRAAMVCLVAVLSWQVRSRTGSDRTLSDSESGALPAIARWVWLAGSLFSLIHAVAAMVFFYDGSHAKAVAETARQTQQQIGIEVPAGIYFNYVFVAVWLMDACWWIARPREYMARAGWIKWSVTGFLVFIAINGTIVFKTGPVRWVAVVAMIALLWLWLRRRASIR